MSTNIFILYLSIAFLLGATSAIVLLLLFNKNFAHNVKMKNKLTETELEMTKLKDILANNIDITSDTIAQMKKQLNVLDEKISEDKKFLGTDKTAIYKIEAKAKETNQIAIPKDYTEDID